MYRVTTPSYTFTLPSDTSQYSEIQVTLRQGCRQLVKHYQDGTLPSGMTLDGKDVVIELTQEETKKFAPGTFSAQVRVLTPSGDSFASQIFTVMVNQVLNEEILA